jgi:DNA-directed RNA polymerase subunit RPC12/RpoP
MSIVIRHRCQRCGARWEGSGSGASAWVRCGSCRALVDFDWIGFFESPAYAEYLQKAARSAGSGWAPYTTTISEAGALADRGDHDGALEKYRAAIGLLMELNSFMYPPETFEDAKYRREVVEQQAWWQLQSRVDPSVSALQKEIEATLRAVDYRAPLPAIRKVAELFRKQSTRLGASDAPPDPDGMAPAQRARLWVSFSMGAWVRMLSAEDRLELLRELHGATNVSVPSSTPSSNSATGTNAAATSIANAAADDGVGIYLEWVCSECGLHSLQVRGALELCCPGCMFRRPFTAGDAPLAALTTACPGCGASVSVAAGALQGRCQYCNAVASRLGETGQVMRDFTAQIIRDSMSKHGMTAPTLPAGGVRGFPVTEQNRIDLVQTGLARTANWYNAMISSSRFASLWRASAAALGTPPLSWSAPIHEHARREGATSAALKLIDEAEALLRASAL